VSFGPHSFSDLKFAYDFTLLAVPLELSIIVTSILACVKQYGHGYQKIAYHFL